ncbi:MAG: hypothetical protein AAGF83_06100 [Cyanobacteria bacterium P01_G01_bin.67]
MIKIKTPYHHTAAVVVAFRQRYAPATTNKEIAALRRVLTEAYHLDLMTARDYQKALDIKLCYGYGQAPRSSFRRN